MLFSDFVEINPRVSLQKGKDYNFVGMEAINPVKRYVTADRTREYTGGGAKFLGGDTLFARITPCLENGKIAQYKGNSEGFGSTEFWIFRAKKGISDPNFLFYLCRTELIRKTAEKSMTGASGRQRADINSIIDLEIEVFDIKTQAKISSVLSAYDDLIENNTQRISILEETARLLYDEWFVKFHFPGHEKTNLINSSLGILPEGWEFSTLQDVCAYISRGISPKYNSESNTFVINQKCIRDGKLSLALARPHLSNFPKEKQIRFGDILINSTGVGTLGRVAQVYQELENYTVDSHVTIVRPKNELDLDYFGLSLIKLQSHFDRLGFGATGQTELSKTSVSNTVILIPPSTLQTKFSQLVSPIRKKAMLLIKQNENLTKTRDFLLPKLISGEVDVSHLTDIETL